MANDINKHTIIDGSRNLVVHVHIAGEGSGSDESETVLIDASSYGPAFTDSKLMRVQSNLIGFSAELLWDATTNVQAWQVPDYDQDQDFSYFGGIPNNAGTGKTGDLLITTTGLTVAADHGTIVLYFKKRNNV